MKGMNKVFLAGNVGEDSVLSNPKENVTLCTFDLATNDAFVDHSGKRITSVEWHSVEAWGSVAQAIHECATKGSRLFIEGKIVTKRYEDRKTGEKISRKVIRVLGFVPGFVNEDSEDFEEEEE